MIADVGWEVRIWGWRRGEIIGYSRRPWPMLISSTTNQKRTETPLFYGLNSDIEGNSMRIMLASLTVFASSFLSGCISSAALVSMPEIGKLEKQPDFFVVMETDVEIENRMETIGTAWRCTQHPVFSASTMTWTLRWKAEDDTGFVAKAIPSGKYLVMGAGNSFDCPYPDTKAGTHSKNVGLLNPSAATLEILFNQPSLGMRDVRIRESRKKIVPATEIMQRASDELHIADQLRNQAPSYAAVPINVWEAASWTKNPVLQAKLEPLMELTFSNQAPSRDKQQNDIFGVLPDEAGLMPHYNLFPVVNGKLALTEIVPLPARSSVYGLTPGRKRNDYSLTFCYDEQCQELTMRSGSSVQLYDPKTRRIIQIGWPHSGIGNNLSQLLQ